MTRVAFKMKLHKGYEEEYKKRHDELWPELEELIEEQPVSANIPFFWMKKPIVLFGVFENRRSGYHWMIYLHNRSCKNGGRI